MSAADFLAELTATGVRLILAGHDLRFQTKPGVAIAPYVERIREYKPSLVALLRNRAPVKASMPPPGWDGTLCVGCAWPALCTVLGPRGPHLVDGPCPAWPAAREGADDAA